MNSSTPALKLQKPASPDWKKFWDGRGFASEMQSFGIMNKRPEVINRIFHTGPYFMVVVDYSTMCFEYVQGVDQMLGFSSKEFNDGKLDFLVNLIHPEDKEKVLGLAVHYYKFLDEQPQEKRMDFKVSINFRLRKADGTYLKVLEQVIGLHIDEEGRITHALKYFTDISHLNYSNEVVFAILDDKEEERQRFYTFNLEEKSVPQLKDTTTSTLSNREIEVLNLIAKGLSSKVVAAELGISTHTIEKHRKNMMRKTGSKNLNEVISFAYCNEYL
jgi:DNA-binding CsgD family transcriptional regulator